MDLSRNAAKKQSISVINDIFIIHSYKFCYHSLSHYVYYPQQYCPTAAIEPIRHLSNLTVLAQFYESI